MADAPQRKRTTWVVGARLVWIEGGFEEGDITGVVREVAPDGTSILITWDDGEVDPEWWAAADDDLTPLTHK